MNAAGPSGGAGTAVGRAVGSAVDSAVDRAPPLPAPTATAHLLGVAGLLPFAAGAGLIWWVDEALQPNAVLALSAYSAVILSFLGGIHWGFAMRQGQPAGPLLWWGVTPSLVAWLSVLLPAAALSLVLHGLMLWLCFAVDRRVYRAQGAAAWLPMRLRLTVVASLGCFVGAAGA